MRLKNNKKRDLNNLLGSYLQVQIYSCHFYKCKIISTIYKCNSVHARNTLLLKHSVTMTESVFGKLVQYYTYRWPGRICCQDICRYNIDVIIVSSFILSINDQGMKKAALGKLIWVYREHDMSFLSLYLCLL